MDDREKLTAGEVLRDNWNRVTRLGELGLGNTAECYSRIKLQTHFSLVGSEEREKKAIEAIRRTLPRKWDPSWCFRPKEKE